MDNEIKKDLASNWFKLLQDAICDDICKLEKNKTSQNASDDAPSLDQNNEAVTISREEAMNEGKRILFENENIKGSMSLTGSKIDDLEFKKFKEELNGVKNVTLLNPSKVKSGYYIETGWKELNGSELEDLELNGSDNIRFGGLVGDIGLLYGVY